MQKNIWIGPDESLSVGQVGQVGFLVEVKHHTKQWSRYELRDLPAHTNMSGQPRLTGWCGSTNDLSTFARGLAKVRKIACNGRVMVERLTDESDIVAALEALGYPELQPA